MTYYLCTKSFIKKIKDIGRIERPYWLPLDIQQIFFRIYIISFLPV